jgi:hypothetical protein
VWDITGHSQQGHTRIKRHTASDPEAPGHLVFTQMGTRAHLFIVRAGRVAQVVECVKP